MSTEQVLVWQLAILNKLLQDPRLPSMAPCVNVVSRYDQRRDPDV